MANRQLLALSKIEEFAAWACTQGFQREPTKGVFEVLRLRYPNCRPILFFVRSRTVGGREPVHATAQTERTKLVHRWLQSHSAAPREVGNGK